MSDTYSRLARLIGDEEAARLTRTAKSMTAELERVISYKTIDTPAAAATTRPAVASNPVAPYLGDLFGQRRKTRPPEVPTSPVQGYAADLLRDKAVR